MPLGREPPEREDAHAGLDVANDVASRSSASAVFDRVGISEHVMDRITCPRTLAKMSLVCPQWWRAAQRNPKYKKLPPSFGVAYPALTRRLEGGDCSNVTIVLGRTKETIAAGVEKSTWCTVYSTSQLNMVSALTAYAPQDARSFNRTLSAVADVVLAWPWLRISGQGNCQCNVEVGPGWTPGTMDIVRPGDRWKVRVNTIQGWEEMPTEFTMDENGHRDDFYEMGYLDERDQQLPPPEEAWTTDNGPLFEFQSQFPLLHEFVSSQTRYQRLEIGRLADLSRCTDLSSPSPLGRLVTGKVGMQKGRAALLWQSPPECQTVDDVLAAAETWLRSARGKRRKQNI